MIRIRTMAILSLIALPTVGIAADVQQQFEFHDINALLTQYSVTEPMEKLRGVATDASGKNHTFLFSFIYDDNQIYLNKKKIFDGSKVQSADCLKPGTTFVMTDDGHVIYSPDCTSLYLDGKRVLFSKQRAQAHVSPAFDYSDGRLVFVAGNVIRQYDTKTERTKALHRVPSEKPIMGIQVKGGNVAYTIRERFENVVTKPSSLKDTDVVKWGNVTNYTNPVFSLYLNGKKIRSEANSPRFFLSADGSLFSFEEGKDTYKIYKGNEEYFVGQGVATFMTEDAGTLWHTSHILSAPNEGTITLFRGKEKVRSLDQALFTKMVYYGGGVIIGKNEKIYSWGLDTSDQNHWRWIAYEDGAPVFSDHFSDIYYLRKLANGSIAVYGLTK